MAGQNNSDTDYQTYYVPDQSKLAICLSAAMGITVIGVSSGINSSSGAYKDYDGGWTLFFIGLVMIILTLGSWFAVTIKENLAGMNSDQLKRSYRMGMQWFIFSEVMFFAGFFGALFYLRALVLPWLAGDTPESAMNSAILWPGFVAEWPLMTTPQEAVGGVDGQAKMGFLANNGEFSGPDNTMKWPGFSNLLTWLPFWNTLLLVTSSVFCEFAHHALKKNDRTKFNLWLFLTLLLGFIFVGVQAYEYYEAYAHYGLTLETGVYGTTFFMLTGFHGFHVCLGAVMLAVQWVRSVKNKHFTADDHFGFEASAWYWHFVDVVWIFLVLVVYLF